eukprot:gene10449-21802_t
MADYKQVVPTDSGVAGLTKVFRSKYKQSWQNAEGLPCLDVDHVCVDMNQILHSSFRTSDSDGHVTAKIFTELNKLLKIVRPLKSVVLSFDGPAPFAKLLTQRKRRIAKPENSQITPGTLFMDRTESLMLCYAFQRAQRSDFRNVSFYISDASSPGEGELKIIDWIQTCVANQSDSIVICGSDSDIILQALTLRKYPRVAVLQRSNEYPDAFCSISSLLKDISRSLSNSLLSPENRIHSTFHNKNIPFLTATYDESKNEVEDLVSLDNIALDMTVLFAMNGNDYIPKLRGLSIDKTLICYAKAMQSLPPEDRKLVTLTPYPTCPSTTTIRDMTTTTDNTPNTNKDKSKEDEDEDEDEDGIVNRVSTGDEHHQQHHRVMQLHVPGLMALLRELSGSGNGNGNTTTTSSSSSSTSSFSPKMIASPMQIPGPLSTLHNMLQRSFMDGSAYWEDFETVITNQASGKNYSSWISTLTIDGRSFTSPPPPPPVSTSSSFSLSSSSSSLSTSSSYNCAKDARYALAEMVLKTMYPDKYKRMLSLQVYAKSYLFKLREAVLLEKLQRNKNNNIYVLKENVNSTMTSDSINAENENYLKSMTDVIRQEIEGEGESGMIRAE